MAQEERSGIIEDLENTENLLVLVMNETISANWQTPDEVIDYVRNNFEYIEDIDIFNVYMKG